MCNYIPEIKESSSTEIKRSSSTDVFTNNLKGRSVETAEITEIADDQDMEKTMGYDDALVNYDGHGKMQQKKNKRAKAKSKKSASSSTNQDG